MTFIEDALESLASNLGVTFPDIILVLVLLSGLIMAGASLRIGLMFIVATLSVTFIVFSLTGMSTYNVLYVLMISFVVLTLSFFIKQGRGPGAV